MRESYDIIVIGAGIGGLNAACMLALEGKKVLVIEKKPFIGGRCSSFEKEGFIVDYGVHAFVNGKEGPLHEPIRKARKLKVIKKDNLIWKRFAFAFLYRGSYLKSSLPMNLTHPWNFVKTLWSFMRFKVPFSDKKEFLKLSFKLRNFPDDEIKALKDKTVMEFIEEHTSSKVSKNIFIIASDCYAVYDHHYVGAQDYVELSKKSFRGKGVSYPIGGCSAIPKAYSEILEATGNTIMTNQAVEKILLEGNKAIGVVLANGNQVMAEKIISNVNWKVMHGTLLSKDAFPTALGGKIENLKHSHSSLVAHIALKKPLIKKKFVMRASDFTNEDAHQMRLKGEKVTDVGGFIPIVSNIDPNLAPPGKQLVCMGLDGRFEFDYDKKAFEELALSFVQELAGKKVNIKDYLEWIHILLPKDLDSLFGEKGSLIGSAQILGQVREDRIDSKTPIENLYHCGDDSGTGLFGVGTELAALSGQHCAKLILTDERIL